MDQKTAIKELMLSKKYHIVFPTYRRLPILLNSSARKVVNKSFERIFVEHKIVAITFKVLTDHVHILINKQSKQQLPHLMNLIKGISTHDFFHTLPEFKIDLGRGRLWAKGYHYSAIKDHTHYINTLRYIKNNYDKYKDCPKA